MKSGALLCYMCWPTYPKWSRTCCKFSTNFFSSSHNSIPTPLFLVGTGNFMNNSGMNQGNLPRRKLRPFLERVGEMECLISFLGSNRRYLVWHYKLLICATNIMNYPTWTCRDKPMRLWVLSWDRLSMVVPIGSGHLPVMMWMDITFTQQATSRVGPIEEPQIPEFLRKA